MKSNLIYLFFLCISMVWAQEASNLTISGYVKDQTTGETILGASVYFQGTATGTSTNSYGFFSLSTQKTNPVLIVSYIGYEDVTVNIGKDLSIPLNILLAPIADELETLVIESSSTDLKVSKPQMSVHTLQSKTIKEIPAVLGEVDVIKALQLLPGVSSAGEGASGFNVRGGAEDQNLVLLDEGIIYNASHLFGFFSVFNADIIKDLKLYKGGIPAKYGGRASSVLDIHQKNGNQNEYNFEGGIGALSSRLLAEGPMFNDKGSFVVAGRASYAHLFLKLANNDNSAYFYDTNLKAHYKLNPKNTLYLSGYFGKDFFQLSDVFINAYGNSSGNLRWNHLFSDQLFANLSLIYSNYTYDLQITPVGFDWNSNIQNTQLKYDLSYFINDKLSLDFGLSGIYYNFNPGIISPVDEDSSINLFQLDKKRAMETAAYLSAEHKLSDKLSLQYGLRLSYFTRMGKQVLNTYENDLPVVYNSNLGIYERGTVNGNTSYSGGENMKQFIYPEPRFNLSYKLNSNSSIKASYHRMLQYLHLISNTSSATPLDIWTPSGPFIKPQIADQVAIGYAKNIKDGDYALEIESYYKTIQNRIDYINGAELVAQNTLETEILNGRARAYGLEFLLRKNRGALTGWLSYTLSRSEQQTPGGSAGGLGINDGAWYHTPFDRTHDLSLTLQYKASNKWRFGSNLIYQTGRPVTYPEGQYEYLGVSVPDYGLRNEYRLPAYHRLDLSATYTPSKNKNRNWKGEWIFSIYNAYNRKNAASITFGQNAETGLNEATKTSIFGIIPAVTYNFKF